MSLLSPSFSFTSDSDDAKSSISSSDVSYTSFFDVHKKLVDLLNHSMKINSDLDQQIDFFNDQVGSFQDWYCDTFKPALNENRKRYIAEVKNLEKAFELKKIGEAFAEMKHEDGHLTERAFEYANAAIKAAPYDEANFLATCFAFRSDLHLFHRSDINASLLDIENALRFRPHSYSCIRRKLDLLSDLKRPHEAYHFLDGILKQSPPLKIEHTKMAKLNEKRCELRELALDVENEVKSKPLVELDQVSVDKRLSMVQNQYHKRYGIFATALIPSGVVVLRERPAIFVLKCDGRLIYCGSCWRSCKDTFWPCKSCNEMIYCSEKCALENEKQHGAECGLVELLQVDTTNVHALQVFRYLMQHGHEKLTQIDQEVIDFKLDVPFNSIASGSMTVTSAQMSQWFVNYQSTLIHRYYALKPERTATEVGTAFFILALYLHRRGLSPNCLTEPQFCDLIRILSTSLYSVAINEYGWTDRSGKVKYLNAAFQCLFASRIGHSCQTNAEWFFDGSRYGLRTTKAIEPRTEICIGFGVNATDTPNVLERQAILSRFQILCNCSVCMADSKKHFCLACEHCSGPVPWHEKIPNDQCINCENKYQRIDVAQMVYLSLKTTQRAIWLLSTVNREDYLPLIESKMSILACYVHLGNEQFLSMIRELCDQYFVQAQFSNAVSWFQWLAHGNGIFLPATEISGSTAFNLDNLLVRFHFLDEWVFAYMCYLEAAGDELSFEDAFVHMTVANRLLNEMKHITKNWNSLPTSKSLLEISQDQKSVGELLSNVATNKTTRYVALAQNVINDVNSRRLLISYTGEQNGDLKLEPIYDLTNNELFIESEELEIYSIEPEDED